MTSMPSISGLPVCAGLQPVRKQSCQFRQGRIKRLVIDFAYEIGPEEVLRVACQCDLFASNEPKVYEVFKPSALANFACRSSKVQNRSVFN